MGEAMTLLSELSGAVIMARGVKTPAMSRQICTAAFTAIMTRLGFSAVAPVEDAEAALPGE